MRSQTGGSGLLTLAVVLAVASPAYAEIVRIETRNLDFLPASAKARVGDTIEWVNSDVFAHTATARNGDWNVMMPPKKTVTLKVTKPGTIAYFCRFHPTMTGTLEIVP
jgi:plastocyanin